MEEKLCSKCNKIMEVFKPSAGPYWKCSECGRIDCCPETK